MAARTSRGPRTPHVLLGVSGGIAAYKSLELVRLLKKAGWQVTAVMTRAGRKFVGPESFRALTGNPVALDLFPRERPASRIPHVDLVASADLVVVAPATANIIGKLAAGIADDLLSTTLLAIPEALVRSGRVLLAPAMNTYMWSHPAVTANIARLKKYGYRIIEPGAGELACGTTGPGRMAEPATIFSACKIALSKTGSRPQEAHRLDGLRVVVTAGRTEEPIDPVRIITNRSTGAMGTAIAQACAGAGAQVTLVAGAMNVAPPSDVAVVPGVSTQAMLAAVLRLLPKTDVLVMCAAVADYRPIRKAGDKYHDSTLTLELTKTPDILKQVSLRRHRAFVVGFSLDDSVDRARRKLREKHLGLIAANPVKTAGSDRITARLLFADGRTRQLPPMSKRDFADRLVQVIAAARHAQRPAAGNRKAGT